MNFVVFTCFRGGQFRHSRLKEGNNLEVSNPMYMAQATEEDEDDSRQPLDQPYDFDPEKVRFFLVLSLTLERVSRVYLSLGLSVFSIVDPQCKLYHLVQRSTVAQ